MPYKYIKQLTEYGIQKGLMEETDRIYATNLLLDALGLDGYEEPDSIDEHAALEETLKGLLDYACEHKLIGDSVVERDLLDARLINCLLPRPSQVIARFQELYQESPKKASDYFYQFSQDTDYIRRYRICKDMKWVVESPYGEIDITINLSKPEKTPKPLQRLSWQSKVDIPNACCAGKMKGTQGI